MKGYRPDPERTEVRVLRRHIRLAGARILEIGCGDGRLTWRIAGVARAVLAVDPNVASITQARRVTPAPLRKRVRFKVGAAEELRLPDQSFDVALLSWSL
jgi:ubiquinone/menaquinone biosynthesis C-methylase UbiE